MPELPEVETTRRGIEPHLLGRRISDVEIRQASLRWPIDPALAGHFRGAVIDSVQRRAKYLLIHTSAGTLILHLGMSGNLRLLDQGVTAGKHDHADIVLDNATLLRLHDPRRFGALLWTDQDPSSHPLMANLGPEPLSADFDGDHLYQLSRRRKAPVKTFIMNSHVVVGVGNIYASEALYLAGIRPGIAAGRVSGPRYQALAASVKQVLRRAIRAGGTTLRDFRGSDGRPGYFQQKLQVYGREGGACNKCGTTIRRIVIANRSTFYCPRCQH